MVSKIVTIEDDAEIAELLCVVLQHPDIAVSTADTGREGLDMVRELRPDLVLLDVMMPGGMNGWEVYDTIRADESLQQIPILMLSVDREAPERRRAFARSEIDSYMTKPFDALRLRREIARMLGREGLWSRNVPDAKCADDKPTDG